MKTKQYAIHFVMSVNGETVVNQKEKGDSFKNVIANIKEIIKLYEAEETRE